MRWALVFASAVRCRRWVVRGASGGRTSVFRGRVENATAGTSVGGASRNEALEAALARFLLRGLARALHDKNHANNLQKIRIYFFFFIASFHAKHYASFMLNRSIIGDTGRAQGARVAGIHQAGSREVEMPYLVNVILPESKKSSRAFSAHKSARSFARRSIREGADLVQIAFRPASAEGSEQDALRNVYRADVDTVNHIRRHVRVPVDSWREMIARLAAQRTEDTSKSDAPKARK